jgi:hypothetical protein
LVDELSAWDLHCEMGDEEGGRQEADGPEADAVRARDHLRGGPNVRDVEADRGTEGETGRGRSCVTLRTL